MRERADADGIPGTGADAEEAAKVATERCGPLEEEDGPVTIVAGALRALATALLLAMVPRDPMLVFRASSPGDGRGDISSGPRPGGLSARMPPSAASRTGPLLLPAFSPPTPLRRLCTPTSALGGETADGCERSRDCWRCWSSAITAGTGWLSSRCPVGIGVGTPSESTIMGC